MSQVNLFQEHRYDGLDPTQAFDVVYGGHFEHRLLAAKGGKMRHRRLVLADTRLETGYYDFPVAAQGVMPKGVVCFGVLADGFEATRYNTSMIERDTLQIYPSGIDLLYHAAGQSRWINFVALESQLQEIALEETGRPLTLPKRDATSLRLIPGQHAKLVQLVDDAFAVAKAQQPGGLHAQLAEEVARALLQGFVSAIHTAVKVTSVAEAAAKRHFQLVLACERLARSTDSPAIDLDELSRRCGYTRRALELIFQRSVGMPPGRWFMNIRLNGALRDLLAPASTYGVADVAVKWGFRHLSRFAQQYQRTFGELPSQTLQRARA
ncbi:helix-turn-helix domain-containing protein [Chitinolyticbacter meiyuanensis]|uniref:helix-turn-helix domain-containing protein n=1 Tax=Chitinolyticbacter meiyuanensis TaxID=682798 RepID=UPI0011E5FF1A|nr:helix-turn-helix domain-containing protein [Chitinolyticbacter meiyuanensis]